MTGAEFVGPGQRPPAVELPTKRVKVVARALTPREQRERYSQIDALRRAGAISVNEARALMDNDQRELYQLQLAGDNSTQIQAGGDVTNISIRAENGSVAAFNIEGPFSLPPTTSGIEHLVYPGPSLEWDHPSTFRDFHSMAQYQLTEHGRLVLEGLLMSWRDGSNRPVVEPWMHLELQPPLPHMYALPVDLMPNDGGKFWLLGNTVYLWAGGRYVTVTLPQPDPEHVVGRPPPPPVQWEALKQSLKQSPPQQNKTARSNPDLWGLVVGIVLYVMSLTAGVVGVIDHGWDGWSTANAVVNVATAGVLGATLTRRAQRRRAAMQLGPLSDDQHDEVASEEPPVIETREFQAASPCPSCGWLDAHRMREPEAGKDPADAVVIRECVKCQQEWGEK